MTINLPWGNEVDPGQRCPGVNKSSCERKVTLAPGQSLPRGSSLSRVHVNRLLLKFQVFMIILKILFILISALFLVHLHLFYSVLFQLVMPNTHGPLEHTAYQSQSLDVLKAGSEVTRIMILPMNSHPIKDLPAIILLGISHSMEFSRDFV